MEKPETKLTIWHPDESVSWPHSTRAPADGRRVPLPAGRVEDAGRGAGDQAIW
ncbi:hypothetical protein [Streptomyces sp. NPDC059168]|uniref:hypothetical protein n=1 Tax=Streptomyces sp. NPDC059168 TaxID=3346753 RepID=UPI0036BB3C36